MEGPINFITAISDHKNIQSRPYVDGQVNTFACLAQYPVTKAWVICVAADDSTACDVA